MTDNGHDHDELRRRLADEGRATAPPDLAPEVMRRVRAEPHRREHRILRPVATLLAAAVLVVAVFAGVSRLGGGVTGSSAGSEGAAGVSQAPKAAGHLGTSNAVPGGTLIRHVDKTALDSVFGQARVPACPRFTANVPGPLLHRVEQQLSGAASDTVVGADTRDVELHRAPKGQTQISITCP
jgi:hypothetical protein